MLNHHDHSEGRRACRSQGTQGALATRWHSAWTVANQRPPRCWAFHAYACMPSTTRGDKKRSVEHSGRYSVSASSSPGDCPETAWASSLVAADARTICHNRPYTWHALVDVSRGRGHSTQRGVSGRRLALSGGHRRQRLSDTCASREVDPARSALMRMALAAPYSSSHKAGTFAERDTQFGQRIAAVGTVGAGCASQPKGAGPWYSHGSRWTALSAMASICVLSCDDGGLHPRAVRPLLRRGHQW